MDKLTLAAQARDYMKESSFASINFRGKDIAVLPTVFTSDSDTPLLGELIEGLVAKVLKEKSSCKVYEMGAGTGAAIISVAQNTKAEAFACSYVCTQYQSQCSLVGCRV